MSLAVKDLQASRAFYEKLDFAGRRRRPRAELADPPERDRHDRPLPGDVRAQHPDLQPRLGRRCQAVEEFTDVREHQRRLKSSGLALATEADEATTGPASVMLVDPDGNPILIDQHV